MKPFGQHPDDKALPKEVTVLLEQVEADGGHVLVVYDKLVAKVRFEDIQRASTFASAAAE